MVQLKLGNNQFWGVSLNFEEFQFRPSCSVQGKVFIKYVEQEKMYLNYYVANKKAEIRRAGEGTDQAIKVKV